MVQVVELLLRKTEVLSSNPINCQEICIKNKINFVYGI
jgi:hypothetical protein